MNFYYYLLSLTQDLSNFKFFISDIRIKYKFSISIDLKLLLLIIYFILHLYLNIIYLKKKIANKKGL
jgi:hypothetical protein